MPLYQVVVDAVRAANGFTPDDDEAFASHLQTLRPSLHALRTSYRSGQGIVDVDYTQEVTEAYLLAYYPHYVTMAWRAVNFLPNNVLPSSGTVRGCIFGTGPGPEPVAIARYLRDNLSGVARLELHLFDIDVDAWHWARCVSLDRILPAYWTGDVDVCGVGTVDLASADFIDAVVADAVACADVIVFQNCLNELATEGAHAGKNAMVLTAEMKPGAILMMSDIDNYPAAGRYLEIVEQTIDSQVAWLHRFETAMKLEIAPGLPSIVRDNLFVTPEYPRINPFPWRCLVAQRLA